MTPAEKTGHVYIVGAGPGDPGLITVAGLRALGRADVVYYDALASSALLRHLRPDAQVFYVGKRAGNHALPQDEIGRRLVEDALSGKTVLRLKGGDPFVFGRGGEEALGCRRAGVPFTVIPGITSAIAGPAYAGIPVTHRGLANAFMVVTGNEAADGSASGIDWGAAARADTLIILMGVATLSTNMQQLMREGRSPETPAALVRWGTRPDQRVVVGTIETIAGRAREEGITSPVVTVVGSVAALASDLAWFDPGPLAGRSVAVTRARAQASDLAAKLEKLGATVLEVPAIEVTFRAPNPELRSALRDRPGWIVWTSASGVEATFAELEATGQDARFLSDTRAAVVGAATGRAARRHGIIPDFVPERATSESLGKEIPDIEGRSVLLAVSSLAGPELAETLASRGANVLRVDAYDNTAQPLNTGQLSDLAAADAITFTSASTAKNLRAALGEAAAPAEARLVSIGPRTSDAVRECFGRLDAEALEPSLDALVDAVVKVLE